MVNKKKLWTQKIIAVIASHCISQHFPPWVLLKQFLFIMYWFLLIPNLLGFLFSKDKDPCLGKKLRKQIYSPEIFHWHLNTRLYTFIYSLNIHKVSMNFWLAMFIFSEHTLPPGLWHVKIFKARNMLNQSISRR